jgi:hypothetical protein
VETNLNKTTSELLVEHYVKWQYESGMSKSQADFAAYIGEEQKYFSMVYNGRKPSKRQTIRFAETFNDPRFYDAVGIERPEVYTDYIRHNLGNVPKDIKKHIAEEVSQYSTEPPPENES